jgi:DNA invertase Pin-like site-specific DNA recombinase
MSARRLAVSYSRFSDPKQAAGDSESRQERDFRAFCARHKLTPVPERFTDRGLSGYRGEHRKRGRLGQLVTSAKEGRFEAGTVIVVEAWDRLGRLRPDKMTALIGELVQTGLGIGVCRLDDIFTEDDFGTHKWTTLAVFVQLAYQESKQKAERVAASWEKRRERAREDGTLLGSRPPAWLECVDGRTRPIPERAAAVRRIFLLAATGYGYTRIIKALTAEGVAPFGEAAAPKANRVRSQFSGKWNRRYIKEILNDRRAVGEFQPRKDDHTPDGPPLPNYYHAVVSEEEYLLARAGQGQRQLVGKDPGGNPRVGRDRKHVNLFRGMLRHARDGEGWSLLAGRNGKPSLGTTAGRDGRGPHTWTFPYHVFERLVLQELREVDPRDVLPQEQTPTRADVLRAQLRHAQEQVAQLQADLRGAFSKAVAAVLREQEDLAERLAGELQDELAKSARPAARAWEQFPGLVEMLAKAPDPVAARLKLRTVLGRLVEEMWALPVRRGRVLLCAAQVFFHGGKHRDYLLVYRAAARHAPGGAWVWSFADVLDPADLDLRRRPDVHQLEQALQALDVSALMRDG